MERKTTVAVCCETSLFSPQGDIIKDSGSLLYLGGLISSDGRPDSEISRRIGMASGDFRALSRFWSHASLPRKRKLELFHALVTSKLSYGLSTLWCTVPQRRRLDGFYARCLRKMLGIPCSFVSRVSNKHVLAKADVQPLTEQILYRQLLLLRRTVMSAAHSPLRRSTFVDESLIPQVGRSARRVGRPRQDWVTELMKVGSQRFGGAQRFETLLQGRGPQADDFWRTELRRSFQVERAEQRVIV